MKPYRVSMASVLGRDWSWNPEEMRGARKGPRKKGFSLHEQLCITKYEGIKTLTLRVYKTKDGKLHARHKGRLFRPNNGKQAVQNQMVWLEAGARLV